MHLLIGVWWAAAGLCGLALIWLALLVAGRRLREAVDRRRDARRRRIRRALRDLALDLGEASRWPRCSLARTAEQLAHLASLVGGPELRRVAAALRASGVYDRLVRRARRGPRTSRQLFIEALTAFPGPDTAAVLRAVAAEPDPAVSLAAWRTLFALGERVRLSDLERDARRRGGRTLDRLELATRIAARHPEEALPYLRDDSISEVVRIGLIEAAGASGSPVVEPTLKTIAELAPSPGIRAAALRALGRGGCVLGDRLLADALGSESWEVRAEAARLVALCRSGALADRLVELLDDEVWTVRHAAGEALTRMAVTGRRRLRRIAEAGQGRPRRIAHFLLQETAA